jgi:hypothetical protein
LNNSYLYSYASFEYILSFFFSENKTNFTNNFKIKTETREVSLGSDYRNNRFETEITYETYEGDLRLKGFSFYNGNLEQMSEAFSGN